MATTSASRVITDNFRQIFTDMSSSSEEFSFQIPNKVSFSSPKFVGRKKNESVGDMLRH